VILAHGRLITPQQTVAHDRILCWQQKSPGTTPDVGMGLVGIALFDLTWLLGFNTKIHDSILLIEQVDDNGESRVLSVALPNHVPANQFIAELKALTG
jgi:hypothetical protein